jgi:mRNA-degrading endonuclease RelE of RelBE toxin-antitoxin system
MNITAYSLNFIHPDFDNQFNRLVQKKKFRKLPAQIADFITEIEKGEFSGDILTRSDDPPYDVYKTRLPNKDTNEGKSNGYRVIYLARHDNRSVAFLLIYYKKEQETVAETYVKALIDGYFIEETKEEEEADNLLD